MRGHEVRNLKSDGSKLALGKKVLFFKALPTSFFLHLYLFCFRRNFTFVMKKEIFLKQSHKIFLLKTGKKTV